MASIEEKEREEAKMKQLEDPTKKEDVYVHTVYNEIASHFSLTRYKPWPIVADFMKTRSPGSVGLDVGCGNGKYLGLNNEIYIVGSDHSEKLTELAFQNNCLSPASYFTDAFVADGLNLPHPGGFFDFAISIAVVHHFSSPERRVEALKHILSKLNSKGEALIYVWALEQQNSRRGWKEGMPQDVLVPWVLQKKKPKNAEKDASKEDGNEKEDVKMRYYHLYKQGELEQDAVNAGGVVVRNGYEKDNWWAVIRRQ